MRSPEQREKMLESFCELCDMLSEAHGKKKAVGHQSFHIYLKEIITDFNDRLNVLESDMGFSLAKDLKLLD